MITSVVCAVAAEARRKTIPMWNNLVANEFFRASLYAWYLQYCSQCDDLVTFKLRSGV